MYEVKFEDEDRFRGWKNLDNVALLHYINKKLFHVARLEFSENKKTVFRNWTGLVRK